MHTESVATSGDPIVKVGVGTLAGVVPCGWVILPERVHRVLQLRSGGRQTDTTDTTDTADTDEDGLDKEIDVSIRNIIQHIIYDKNKDD